MGAVATALLAGGYHKRTKSKQQNADKKSRGEHHKAVHANLPSPASMIFPCPPSSVAHTHTPSITQPPRTAVTYLRRPGMESFSPVDFRAHSYVYCLRWQRMHYAIVKPKPQPSLWPPNSVGLPVVTEKTQAGERMDTPLDSIATYLRQLLSTCPAPWGTVSDSAERTEREQSVDVLLSACGNCAPLIGESWPLSRLRWGGGTVQTLIGQVFLSSSSLPKLWCDGIFPFQPLCYFEHL